MAAHHTNPKQTTNVILENDMSLKVFFHSKNNTHDTMSRGMIVSSILIILNANAPPSKSSRCTLSRAKIINDEAPCSKLIQKKMVNTAKMINAIMRSLIIFSYLNTLEKDR